MAQRTRAGRVAPVAALPEKKDKKSPQKAPAKDLVKKSSTSASSAQPATSSTTRPTKTPETTTISTRKRERSEEHPTTAKPTKRLKAASAINTAPSEKLDVYVFGLGEYGELGLGPTIRDGKKPKGVRRPRLNDLLDVQAVGVVQIAVGGMHCVALTHDQKVLTWGVNDHGALGRDTTWEEPTRDIDAGSDSDSDEDDTDLNPRESTPTAIPTEYFGKDAKVFVQVVATDSASFALTEDGYVYGWGTFSGNDGAIGFFTADAIEAAKKLHGKKSEEKKFQRRPALIPQLKKIKFLAAGGNHVQALDHKGNVFSWGSGEQSQLGRRVVDRNRALTPCQFGLPRNKVSYVSCGAYHSFAIDVDGHVYAWGLSNFGQTGITAGAGESDSFIQSPSIVQSLEPYQIKEIKGGNHHSVACTKDGKLLVWGRCDYGQGGIPLDTLPKKDLIFDERNKPRIIIKPAVIPNINTSFVAAGIDNSFAITKDGKAYSWGYSENYRTGQGTDEPVQEATLISNTAVTNKKLNFAGCGGQFSVLTGFPNHQLSNGS